MIRGFIGFAHRRPSRREGAGQSHPRAALAACKLPRASANSRCSGYLQPASCRLKRRGTCCPAPSKPVLAPWDSCCLLFGTNFVYENCGASEKRRPCLGIAHGILPVRIALTFGLPVTSVLALAVDADDLGAIHHLFARGERAELPHELDDFNAQLFFLDGWLRRWRVCLENDAAFLRHRFRRSVPEFPRLVAQPRAAVVVIVRQAAWVADAVEVHHEFAGDLVGEVFLRPRNFRTDTTAAM